jgi:phage host-nuclease inhibitor protein Gam
MSRSKTTILTREQFELNVDIVAQLQIDMQSIIAERNDRVQRVQETYNVQIESIKKEIDLCLKTAGLYASQNRALLLNNEQKSSETALARFGFRTGQPTVKPIQKIKEEELANELRKDGYKEYTDESYTLNKPAIKKGIEAGVQKLLSLFKIVQNETFYVEAKAKE